MREVGRAGGVMGADTKKRGQQEDGGARNARSHEGLEGQAAEGCSSPVLPSRTVTPYILVVSSPRSAVICHLRTILWNYSGSSRQPRQWGVGGRP